MKTKFFLLLCLLLLTIKCDGGEGDNNFEKNKSILKHICTRSDPENQEDCFGIFNETVQETYKMYCCYNEYKFKNKPSDEDDSQEFIGCDKIDKEEYDDLDAWFETLKANAKADNNEFVEFYYYCNKDKIINFNSSTFLKLGLISLFAVLLI